MGDTVKIRVSLAVLLVDDFTDKFIISPMVKVSVEGQQKPIRKAEGFYIFTNLSQALIKVIAEGYCYFREEKIVDLRCLDKAEPVIKMRLRPNQCYRGISKAISLSVNLPEHTRFSAFYEGSNMYKRLLRDYEKDNPSIMLYQGDEEELEGKMCCITAKDGTYERFCLGAAIDKENAIYFLEQKPSNSYKKIETKIYPAAFLESEKEGEYFVLLKGYGEKALTYTCILEQETKKSKRKIELKVGKENREDFRNI